MEKKKIKVAIPCLYYTEIELDVQDDELISELENDVVEDLELSIEYETEIKKQLRPHFKYIDSLKNFNVDEDGHILYWIP